MRTPRSPVNRRAAPLYLVKRKLRLEKIELGGVSLLRQEDQAQGKLDSYRCSYLQSKEIELKEDSTVVYNATGAQYFWFTLPRGGGGNAAPVLAGVDSSTLAYNKGDPATPIAASITVSDGDTDVGAAVTRLADAEDVLSVTIAQGSPISASYSAPTLTLSGTGTLAQYQTVLRTVSYSNSDTTSPTTTTRTAQFTVNDGTADSNVATRSISIIDGVHRFPDGLSAGLSGGDKIEFESAANYRQSG